MLKASLDDLMKKWFAERVDSLPEPDPSRTAACLRFDEVDRAQPGTELYAARRDHIEGCGWCQRVLRLAARASSADQETALYDTAPRGALSDALREFARTWFHQNEPEPGEPSPGFFDAAGNLHLDMPVSLRDGTVRVRLLADEYPIPVGSFTLRGGRLQLEHPMPEWGLQSVRISVRGVEVEPVAG
jgi:hypothetical protein